MWDFPCEHIYLFSKVITKVKNISCENKKSMPFTKITDFHCLKTKKNSRALVAYSFSP